MKLIKLLKKDLVLTISFLLALLSSIFVKPDKEYISYINLPVLVLLFCLMLVVAGLKKSGVFDKLKSFLSSKITSEKMMILWLCMICFFSSALITNDVALITFVPFSIAILKKQDMGSLIFCVVMETIAANLGSLITPIGNPQNLFLYTHYNITPQDFFKITLPLGAVCLLMILICLLFRKSVPLKSENENVSVVLQRKILFVFSLLFVLCILSVLKVISCYVTLIAVLLCVLFINKKLFYDADYILLITFVFFFIFAGNMARIPVIYDFIQTALNDRVVLVSAIISQAVSNVPAATMLSSFTNDVRSLILGTNIGGLGTVIASMASLISYRYIAKENVNKGKYMLVFTIFNFSMLIVLLLLF